MDRFSSPTHPSSALYRRVAWRVLPILFTCYLINYLDRVNVSFATLTMSKELGIDPAAYGFGAGLFFIGYFFFEVPSNLMLYRFGARIWIARIVFSWGICSMATALVRNEAQFFLARFLLGACEAGFFPGVILYLSWWFPLELRGRVTAGFFSAVAVAGLLGGPFSGWILERFERVGGLESWQWLFLLEGLPCLLVGFWVLFGLPDRPRNARWLSEPEQEELESRINEETAAKHESGAPSKTWAAFRIRKVWLLALLYFTSAMGLYGVSFWLPTIVRQLGWSDPLTIGLLTAIPWSAALIGMFFVSKSSDRHGERRLHAAISAGVAALAFVVCAVSANPWVDLVAISMSTAGTVCYVVVLLTFPSQFLNGTAAAAGIAIINSVGNLGGFVSPTTIGWLTNISGTSNAGEFLTAGFLAAGCGFLFAARRELSLEVKN